MATIRRRQKSFSVWAAQGYKVVDRTTVERASLMEQLGTWIREYDTATGELLGFRINGADTEKVDSDLRHLDTLPTITETEMETVAGLHGKSRTYGLRESERLKLIKEGELPEDEIERALAKFRVYDQIGAAKGDILRVWPKRIAEQLCVARP